MERHAAYPAPWEPIDQAYAGLRVCALLAGLAYPHLARVAAGVRHDVLIAFLVFAAYGSLAYGAAFRWFRSAAFKRRFYALLGAADLAFVLVLMNLTGGEASPFYRALYLWVAMPAFYFGLRTGAIASAVAFCVFVWFFDLSTKDSWEVLVRAGGLLLHGPLIGYLIDHERTQRLRLRELQARVEHLEHEQPPPVTAGGARPAHQQ